MLAAVITENNKLNHILQLCVVTLDIVTVVSGFVAVIGKAKDDKWEQDEVLTWKILYLTWLISIQVFSAAGRFWSRDLNLDETEGIVGIL